jgi:PII-like signaling protein
MEIEGRALCMTILVDDTDTWHHKPLFTEIVERAHAFGLAGATVFRGVEGFGETSIVHTTRLLSMADDLPVAIVIVDEEDRIRSFAAELEELSISGLIILQEVEVIHYRGRGTAST